MERIWCLKIDATVVEKIEGTMTPHIGCVPGLAAAELGIPEKESAVGRFVKV